MKTIKLIDVRMMVLRAAMKKEEQRLQNVADQVARIAAGLDMDLKSSAGIDEILAKLRKNLKKQSGNWAVMRQLAEQASTELHQKDADVARKAKGLDYSARQFAQSVQTSAFFSAAGGKLVQDVAHPTLGLSALNKLDMTQELGELFGGIGHKFGDALQGVSLGELRPSTLEDYSTAGNHDVSPGFLGDLDTESVVTTLGAGAAGIAGIAGLASLFDRKGTAAVGTPSGPAVLGAVTTTGRKIDIDIDKADLKNIMQITSKVGIEAIKFVPEKVEEAKAAANAWVEQKQEEYDTYIAEQELKAKQMTEETGREYNVDIFGQIYDVEERKEQLRKEEEEKEKRRLANRNIFEKALDGVVDFKDSVWETCKDIANSKPVEYAGDAIGSAISAGADGFSLVGNVITGNWSGVVSDAYSFSNNYTSFCQDTTALGNYAIGAGLEGFGYDEAADYYYAEAEEYAGREGIADELHGLGLDFTGTLVDFTDFGMGVYKTTTGIQKLNKAFDDMKWTSLDEVGGNLFELSGWKDIDVVSGAATAADRFKYYKDASSNVKLGYKYLDALLDEGIFGRGGLIETAAQNTSPGKAGKGIIDNVKSFLNVIESAATAYDD